MTALGPDRLVGPQLLLSFSWSEAGIGLTLTEADGSPRLTRSKPVLGPLLQAGPMVRIRPPPAESPREPDCRRGAGHQSTASLSAMVVNGWGPGAENADHGKNSKAERLLEEHRASERGYRSR